MSCNFCKNAVFENYGFDDREITIGLAAGGSYFPKHKQFQYCPKCGKPLGGWISIKEREPEGDRFWLYNAEKNWVVQSEPFVFSAMPDYLTHWMPINLTPPEPPKEVDAK